MSQLKLNIIASYAGRGWMAVMSLAFVPTYIRLMGIESYGLVGFYATLLGLLPLLDLGLKTTLNRELARLSAEENRAQEAADYVRTLEVIYWSAAGIIAVLVCSCAAPISHHWVKAQHLSVMAVQQSIVLMGITVALQFPFDLYSGGLLGLQRQVLLNGLTVVTATLRGFGAVLVLTHFAPTVQTFFVWQAVVCGIQTGACACLLWRNLPVRQMAARFRRSLLQSIRRFAIGMTGIGILSVVLMQMDNLILIRLLPLRQFGYYTLAKQVAVSLTLFIGPIFDALFPTFCRLVALNDPVRLKALYHRSCQLMSAVILPVALVLILFSRDVVLAWTNNPLTAAQTQRTISLLAIGTALNGLMNLPYALQLAYGWTRLTMLCNLVGVIVYAPLIVVMASRYGTAGAACVWVILNSGYVLITLNLMHRRLLPGEQVGWYLEDVGLPLLATLSIAALARGMFPTYLPRLGIVVGLGGVWIVAFVAAVLAAPQLRAWLIARRKVAASHVPL